MVSIALYIASTFNRTNVELKRKKGHGADYRSYSFNRTNVELKQFRSWQA